MAGDEIGDPVAEEQADQRRTYERVVAVGPGNQGARDVVHEPGELQLDVARRLTREQVRALEVVGERGDDVAAALVPQSREQLVDGVERFRRGHVQVSHRVTGHRGPTATVSPRTVLGGELVVPCTPNPRSGG